MVIQKKSNVPVYKQIQDIIIQKISDGSLKPGDSVFSEHEMSHKLNVSRQTVRKSYSILEKEGIVVKVHGKGTFVAGDTHQKESDATIKPKTNTKVIGVLFPEMTLFFPKILKGIEEKATEKGYSINIMFNESFEKEEQAINTLLEKDIDGIILTPFRSFGYSSVSNYMLLLEKQMPVAMVGKPPKRIKCDAVYCDDVQGSYDAVKKVISSGYEKVIHITSSQHDIEAVEERKEGYTLAVEECLGKEQSVIVDMSNLDWEKGLRDIIRGTKDKMAVFLDTDNIAPIIYNIINSEKKNIPDDIGIISVDNSTICENLPVSLSSIEHPQQLIGNIAFELLYEKLQSDMECKKRQHKHIILDTKLIKRQSI